MSDPLFASGDREVARVALPVPVDALFDYAVPDRLARQAVVGCRVLVPFRERRLAGVVLERAGRSDFSGALRPIEKVLDTEPALSPTMLGILREAAAQVLCPIGLAVAAALPPGAAPRSAS
ncbi:MAG: hypothetical protein OEM49_15475, partial [Myxococcales bacterium]|nr:hypothetical protein [Myxococcales bacterium]